MKSVDLMANKIKIKISKGNIYDFEMIIDMKMNYDRPYHDWYTITSQQSTFTSLLKTNYAELIPPIGLVDQHGTTMVVGTEGVKIQGNYRYSPAYENSYHFERRHDYYTKSETRCPKQGGIMSAGNVVFLTKDVTLHLK